jgi:hydrogenase expression/formation protein HypC
MCLAVPGKIVQCYEEGGLPMGKVDFDGTAINACLVYVPEAKEGQFVIVHAGFALNIVDEEEAQKTLELWQELEEHERRFREESSPDNPGGLHS